MIRVIAGTIFLLTQIGLVNAQLIINNTLSSNDLVNKILVGGNDNLLIDNIIFVGSTASIGSFKYNLTYNNLISKGIILSTGKVMDAIGPNDVPNMNTESFKVGYTGDSDLEQLAQMTTYDASVLEFDFMSNTDSISFNFFFASEEYPEFVNRNVNDIFGFFLIDKNQGTKENIALLPISKTLISIDNVNSLKNNEYFIENPLWDAEKLDFFSDHLDLAELSHSFQFDGLTKTIQVGSKVQPNRLYSLKLAVADVGDDIFDTAVFLEAESFKSTGKPSDKLPIQLLTHVFDDEIIEISDSMVLVNSNITFAFDSDSFVGENSYSFLNELYTILNYNKRICVEIQGHTDNVGSNEYNLELSENRAKNVMNYLLSKGLDEKRVAFIGFGNSKPISAVDNDLNRRVEILLYEE